jgi:hypothetical protein
VLSRAAQQYVRYAEVAIVLVLGIIAFITWRELDDLRKAPVALPNYEFDVSTGADAGNVVQTRGTWISEKGIPDSLQTITLECRKPTMRCTESSAAVVFVEGRGVLESRLMDFEVDHWNDKEIVAKPYTDRCMTRTLALDLRQKRARSHVNPITDDSGRCRPQRERSLELVAGYKLKEQPR